MRLYAPISLTVLVAAMAFSWANAALGDTQGDRLNRVHVVYVTNRDREPRPGYRERLHRIMTDVQGVYRDEMARNGYGPMTFSLDLDKEGRTRVHLVELDWDFDPKRKFTPREIRPAVAKRLADEGIDIASKAGRPPGRRTAVGDARPLCSGSPPVSDSPEFIDLVTASAEEPRTGEGDMVALCDGSVFFAYTCFQQARDDARADIVCRVSHDMGRTWDEPRVLVRNDEAAEKGASGE